MSDAFRVDLDLSADDISLSSQDSPVKKEVSENAMDTDTDSESSSILTSSSLSELDAESPQLLNSDTISNGSQIIHGNEVRSDSMNVALACVRNSEQTLMRLLRDLTQGRRLRPINSAGRRQTSLKMKNTLKDRGLWPLPLEKIKRFNMGYEDEVSDTDDEMSNSSSSLENEEDFRVSQKSQIIIPRISSRSSPNRFSRLVQKLEEAYDPISKRCDSVNLEDWLKNILDHIQGDITNNLETTSINWPRIISIAEALGVPERVVKNTNLRMYKLFDKRKLSEVWNPRKKGNKQGESDSLSEEQSDAEEDPPLAVSGDAAGES